MSIQPEALAVRAAREWLLQRLPAKCDELNAMRRAVLRSALVEPFDVATGDQLKLSTVGIEDASPSVVDLVAGVGLSAQDVADDINLSSPVGITASAEDGHLVLTADAVPEVATPSVVAALTANGNAIFGWEEGGENCVRTALEAPSYRGVTDGLWLTAPDLGKGFWVMLGDRTATNVGNARRAEFLVSIQVQVFRTFGLNQTPHRDREAITACIRAVREVLTDDSDGRQLGRAKYGDVMFTDVQRAAIVGEALQSKDFYFDAAGMELTVRMYQPAAGP